MNRARSKALFETAKSMMVGGVNSPVRAFKSVGGDPVFIARAQGATLTDVDGNDYIDYVGSWGPMILGHAHPAVVAAVVDAARAGTSFGAPSEGEVRLAEAIRALVPSIEVVRMVNSGTEATMSALRVARGFTGRSKAIKFEGCYHGHGDSFLIKAGSGAATFGVPDSAGVPPGVASDTLTAKFNDAADVARLLAANPGEVAAIFLEPVVGNMGVVPPEPGFLQALRDLCDREGTLLVFDEVMTGFRVARGGAQERYGIRPDLTTLGKIVGGGLPVGAYGGRAEIMRKVAPDGPVYQAGTLSGNPLAMAAGLATLARLTPDVYTRLETLSARLEAGLRRAIAETKAPACVQRVGSMMTLFLTPGPVRNWQDADRADRSRFANYFRAMLAEGICLPPAQFEALFVSAAHTEAEIDRTIDAAAKALAA
jgi:glutamate-1-semialdehyde 2,1-aminomutase